MLRPRWLQAELQEQIGRFFIHHKVRVEIDPDLTPRRPPAHAHPLALGRGCTEYDRTTAEHEAYVHLDDRTQRPRAADFSRWR